MASKYDGRSLSNPFQLLWRPSACDDRRSCPMVLMAIVALAAACSRQQAPPASPTAVAPDVSDAAADGSTLKASAPTLQSPINGVQAPAFQPVTLVLANAATTYTTAVALSYRFEVINAAGAVVENALVAGGSGATTSRTVPTTLQDGATYSGAGAPNTRARSVPGRRARRSSRRSTTASSAATSSTIRWSTARRSARSTATSRSSPASGCASTIRAAGSATACRRRWRPASSRCSSPASSTSREG